jgi:hypothetical protein
LQKAKILGIFERMTRSELMAARRAKPSPKKLLTLDRVREKIRQMRLTEDIVSKAVRSARKA